MQLLRHGGNRSDRGGGAGNAQQQLKEYSYQPTETQKIESLHAKINPQANEMGQRQVILQGCLSSCSMVSANKTFYQA